MTEKKLNNEDLALVITKAGRILIENGAEIWRVEDTMTRLALAYGADSVDSYATPTMLIVSFAKDGHLIHNVKRVRLKAVDLAKLAEVNALSRQAGNRAISLEALNVQLSDIEKRNDDTFLVNIIGVAICVLGFAFFFGANFHEALWAIIIAILAKAFTFLTGRYVPSAFFNHLAASFILTFFAGTAAHIFPLNRDTIIISGLMLFVPGLAITNAIRDSVGGDLLSGLSRATEALFIAIALALGSVLGFMLTEALW